MQNDLKPIHKITTSNGESGDNLQPSTPEPWTSTPQDPQPPKITVELPAAATITEVTLIDATNVIDFTVSIVDEGTTIDTVSRCIIILLMELATKLLTLLYIDIKRILLSSRHNDFKKSFICSISKNVYNFQNRLYDILFYFVTF